MILQRVELRTAELAAAVGPIDTLVAMARLEDALAALERELDEEPPGTDQQYAEQRDVYERGQFSDADQALGSGDVVIDLREVRETLARAEPVLARAELRIGDMASALEGR